MQIRIVFALIFIGMGLSSPCGLSAQSDRDLSAWKLHAPETRMSIVKQLREAAVMRHELAWKRAMDEGWSPKGVGFELQSIRNNRLYIYHTMNINAAISTAATSIRNTAPYNVNGSGITVGLWDGGWVRSTHQELTGRVTIKDTGASINNHSTHIGGTLGAVGIMANANGMAPAVHIDSYDWNNDSSEMASRCMATAGEADTIQLSNHSYGYLAGWDTTSTPYYWYGIWGQREDTSFGQYDVISQEWDTLCYNAPYYLPCKAAGNDRNEAAPSSGTRFYYYSGVSWKLKTYNPATDPYGDGYDNGGFDTITCDSTSKNILTVGAVNDAVSGGARSLPSATMTAFSSWGPTDDGRIKPDVVGNGWQLYSSLSANNTSYGTMTGTSMATPNVCGSAVLLTDYYGRIFPGQYMRASTLKGLIIHTADDLGNVGPDYKFGWGLMNTKAAADLIKLHHDVPSAQHLAELSLDPSTICRTNAFTWDGSNAIRATLCWTDPAGTAQTGLDNTTRALVNDLDLQIIGPSGQTCLPYVLAPATPDVPATTGDNNLDNVEQVYIAAPEASGQYKVIVSLHGGLTGSNQIYSLILSGSGALMLEITFNAQGGTTPEPATTNVTYGASYDTLATTARTGYVFDGWWTAADGAGTEVTATTTVTIAEAQTLYAKWTPDRFMVTFDTQGGTDPAPLSTYATYGATYDTLATTVRTGYTFDGWWTAAGGAGTEVTAATTVTITEAQTLYAKWTPHIYPVTFDAQGGTTPDPAYTNVTYGTTYGPLATTSADRTFGGWWTAPGEAGTEVTASTIVTITAAQTLYAKWLTASHYRVFFDTQDGTAPNPESINVLYNTVYGALANTTRTGFTFGGWWTGLNGTGMQVTPATLMMQEASHTLYAFWTGVITATTDAGGAINPSGIVPVAYACNTNIVIQPDPNYHIAAILVNGLSVDLTNDFTFVNVTSNQSIHVRFEPDWYELVVTSPHGGTEPGTLMTGYNSIINQRITNSPVVNVSTQYVCSGMSVTGNDFTPLSSIHMRMALTNNATLTWLWTTNYWLDTATNGAGTISVNDGWQCAGSNVTVSAAPTPTSHFMKWSGDTNGCFAAFTELTVPMTQPRKITAVFANGATPKISGRVTRSGTSVGVANITIAFSGGAGTAITDTNGNYSQIIPYNWSGKATAACVSGGFAAPTRTYLPVTLNKTLQNYIWSPNPFISGRVTKSAVGMPDVTINFSNGGGTATTDASGIYSNTVPYGWSGMAMPLPTVNGGFSSKTYTALKINKTLQNYTWGPDPVVSGKVTKSGTTTPVMGATIAFSNIVGTAWSYMGIATTSAGGTYSMTVPYNWTGKTLISFTNGGFAVASKTYTGIKINATLQNYVWSPDPIISGKIMKSGTLTALPDVSITFTGVGTATTGINGLYSQQVPYGWSGTTTPSNNLGGRFTPVSKTYTNLKANTTSQNYTWTASVILNTPTRTSTMKSGASREITLHVPQRLVWITGEVHWTGDNQFIIGDLTELLRVRIINDTADIQLPQIIAAAGEATIDMELTPAMPPRLAREDEYDLLTIRNENGTLTIQSLLTGTIITGFSTLLEKDNTMTLAWDLTVWQP